MRTEGDICATAYDIQDACNFYPVVMELHKTIHDLKQAGVEHQDLKTHPAVIIMVDKINDMMGRPDFDILCKAFTYCREKAYEGLLK